MTRTGYTFCDCRDCFEIAIDGGLCNACEEHGCEPDGSAECQSPYAYGQLDNEDAEVVA